MSEIPSILEKKHHIGAYSALFSKIYLEEKATKEGVPIGAIMDKLIMAQKDFKEHINRHLEHLKIK